MDKNKQEFMSFFELRFILLRYKKSIILTFLMSIIFSLAFNYMTLGNYQSSAKIILDDVSSKNSALFDIATGTDRNLIQNQVEILKSRKIAELTLEKILEGDVKNNLYLLMTKDENEDYSNRIFPALRKITFLEKKHYDSYEIALKNEDTLNDRAIDSIQNNLSVYDYKNSDILTLTYESKNPHESAYILNTILGIYQKQDIKWENDENVYLREFLSSQIKVIGEELSNIEEKLKSFQKENKIFSLDNGSDSIIKSLELSESELYIANAEINILEQREKYYQNQLSEDEINFSSNLTNTINLQLSSLRTELAKLEAEYVVTKSREDINKIALQAIERKIYNLKKSINLETKKLLENKAFLSNPIQFRQSIVDSLVVIRASKNMFVAKTNELAKVVNIYNVKLQDMPEKFLELSRLQRDKIILDDTYTLMKRKFEETRISEASKLGKITIIDRPIPSKNRSFPPPLLLLFIGSLMFFAFLLSLIIALIEKFDDTLSSIEFLEDKGLSILSIIPQVDKVQQLNLDRQLFVLDDAVSPISEAFKALRTSLSFTFSVKENSRSNKIKAKTVLISSSGPKEGKSTVSLNLAATYAMLGKKTVLIDFDMRKPVIAKTLGLSKEKGISNIFVNDESIESNLQKSNQIEGFDILGCGPIPPNPSEILSSEKIKIIIDQLSDKYDYIISDSPPLAAVSDASILSPLFDQFLLVTKSGLTQKSALDMVLKIFKRSNNPLKNCVLNGVSETTTYGQGYYYQYYQNYKYIDSPPDSEKNS